MRQAAEFLSLPYHRTVQRDPEGSWSAAVLELDGVFSGGDSADEALNALDEAMELWIELEFEAGRSIPRPWGSRTYSGTLNLRLPKALHAAAAARASIEGVSLNQLLVTAVASYLGDLSAAGTITDGRDEQDRRPNSAA